MSSADGDSFVQVFTMWHDLPDGVLQIIAEHMRSQDWAKARGACQTFARVQPRRLALFPSSMAALRWCTKLWQQADSVALNLGHLDIGSSEVCQILERGARSLQESRLAELCIEGIDLACLGDTDEIMYETEWLTAILWNARSLQRLVLRCECITKFPVLSQLRHLVLHVYQDISRQACSSIEELTSLETISIRMLMDDIVDSSLPALDLSACKSLAAVDLQYVVPEKLLGVPIGCLVRMLYVSDGFPNEALRSLCQVCTGISLRPHGMVDTTPWCAMLCLSWPWLTSLEIDTSLIFDQLGVPLILGGAMPWLRSLTITSFHLVLRIEAPIHLQQLIITTHRICELAVEDLPVLVDEMATLTVRPWFGEKSITVHDSGYSELLNAYAASVLRRGISDVVKMVQLEHSAPPSECACGGACLDCLRELGVLRPI